MQILSSGSAIAIYSIAFIAASLLYLVLAAVVRGRTLRRPAVLSLIALGIAVRAALLPFHPVGSDDVYRYLWDGRVQSAGVDPYAYAPADSALAHLHTAELPSRVNNPSVRTPYFPLTQWVFLLVWWIAGENALGIKVLLFLAECVTLFLLGRLLRIFDLPRQHILLYALCPLPIVMFALDAHIDGIGLPLLLLAVNLWSSERRVTALLIFGLSLAIKPVALVLLPVLFFAVRPWRERMTIVFVPLAVVVLQFVPYLWTSNPFAGIAAFGRHWYYNGAAFEIVMAIVRDNLTSRTICAVILAGIIFVISRQRSLLPVAAYRSVMILLLLSPVVHPWYITWLAVLLPLTAAWSGITFVALASVTSLTMVEYITSGTWGISPWLMVVEYVPVVVLFTIEMIKKEQKSTKKYQIFDKFAQK